MSTQQSQEENKSKSITETGRQTTTSTVDNKYYLNIDNEEVTRVAVLKTSTLNQKRTYVKIRLTLTFKH